QESAWPAGELEVGGQGGVQVRHDLAGDRDVVEALRGAGLEGFPRYENGHGSKVTVGAAGRREAAGAQDTPSGASGPVTRNVPEFLAHGADGGGVVVA